MLGGHAGPTLGLACAGVVTAVGADVDAFKPGDRVLATAPATLATEVVTKAHTVAPLPESLDFAAAATLPVAFITVIYALGHLGQLKAGERVLIHGGAGGVGLAAIQYAKHCGAEVIATSGSPTKRSFLREFGADHVLNSRDLAFVDAINELTGGQGIDVVLNSLSGDAMEQSLALVRPFGRFLELGKRDFFLGTRIGLKPLRRNISYFAIDVNTLAVERPDLSAALMRQTIDLIESGALRPLPYRRFARSEISDAFRLMQASGHIGKIVVEHCGPRGTDAARATDSVGIRRAERRHVSRYRRACRLRTGDRRMAGAPWRTVTRAAGAPRCRDAGRRRSPGTAVRGRRRRPCLRLRRRERRRLGGDVDGDPARHAAH